MNKGFDWVAIIFWIAIIFIMDPGGFISSSTAQDIDSARVAFIRLGIVALAYGCFFLKYSNKENRQINDKFLQWYTYVIIAWSIYYFFWYYGLNNNEFVSPMKLITRNLREISQMLIVFPIAYFASIRLDLFVKILSWSTIIILIMFILSIFFNLGLVEILEGGRGMGLQVKRYFMGGYGIMSFTVPLALSLLIMKYKFNKIIVFAAILSIVQSALAILRKDFVGILEYTIIIAFLVNYINKSKLVNFLWRFINIKSISFVFIVIIFVIIVSPGTIETATVIIETTYRTAILGEDEPGSSDSRRMSLTAQYQTVRAIEENLLLGTGFFKEWGAEGSGAKGFEGSDYIFLSVWAMYGLVGILIFLPFYIITVKLIVRLLKLLRDNVYLISQDEKTFKFPVIIGLAASAEFIKNIIEYPNWFFPIGITMYSPKYWIYFGLLVGSYYQIVKRIKIYKLKQYEE